MRLSPPPFRAAAVDVVPAGRGRAADAVGPRRGASVRRWRNIAGVAATTAPNGAGRWLKEATDRLTAAAGLVALAPLLLLIALAIRLDSPGPVLYRQARHGRGGRVFTLVKFRTLYADRCDAPAGAFRQVTRDDPRVTRIGRFLRRTSLDELPQLLNVLTGDMSIVGPRPHALALAAAFGPKVKDYALRHQVKPGITGWAQVNGMRGETPTVEAMAKRVQLDIEYVRKCSFLFDLKIILLTFVLVLREMDAY